MQQNRDALAQQSGVKPSLTDTENTRFAATTIQKERENKMKDNKEGKKP